MIPIQSVRNGASILKVIRFRYRIHHGVDNLLPGHVTMIFNKGIATKIEALAG
jgi:hypothetical protein